MSVSCPPKSPLDQLTGLAERELASAADPVQAESALVARLDGSQLRTGAAPRALAALRNLAISAIRLAGRANIAHARRDLHDNNDAFALLRI